MKDGPFVSQSGKLTVLYDGWLEIVGNDPQGRTLYIEFDAFKDGLEKKEK